MSLEPKYLTSKTPKARILIVEDQADQWKLIQNGIQQAFDALTITWVPSADLALAYLKDALAVGAQLPQLILLDLYLPERQTGWQLLEAIKALPGPVNRLPVVMLSYSQQADDIRELYQRGAASYLTKPSNVQDWRSFFRC